MKRQDLSLTELAERGSRNQITLQQTDFVSHRARRVSEFLSRIARGWSDFLLRKSDQRYLFIELCGLERSG